MMLKVFLICVHFIGHIVVLRAGIKKKKNLGQANFKKKLCSPLMVTHNAAEVLVLSCPVFASLLGVCTPLSVHKDG